MVTMPGPYEAFFRKQRMLDTDTPLLAEIIDNAVFISCRTIFASPADLISFAGWK